MIIASIASTGSPSFGLLRGAVMMLSLHWAYGDAPGMCGNVFPLKTLVGLRLSLRKDLLCSFQLGCRMLSRSKRITCVSVLK